MTVDKDTLRFEAIRHRDRINPADPGEDPDKALSLFTETIKVDAGQVVGAYWPKGREFDPRGILEYLLKRGIICALPVIEKDNRILKFTRWDEAVPLTQGAFGVYQPEITDQTQWVLPDILLVPLLAFDRRGYRLGYGGGYYDATLQALRQQKEVLAVGVCYAQQAVIFNLPAEPHDEKLDWIITPQKAHRFI